MKKLAYLTVLAALTAFLAAPAFAQSSKAAWRYENIVALGTASCDNNNNNCSKDTGFVSILTTHIKTPNGKELAMGVSLQCGLVTDTTVKSKGGNKDTSEARGRIRVRVKITQPDGIIVYGQPDNGGDLTPPVLAFATDPPGLTYCDRFQKLDAKFAGLNCTVDPDSGFVTCTDPEELRLILKTLNVNHFNFLHANAMPGIHKVEVQARAQANVALGGTELDAAAAEAFAGAGALYVETIRLVKDADGTTELKDLK